MDNSDQLEALKEENQKLRNIIDHLFPEKTGVYFVCGESGEKDQMGLPDKILVCPTHGLDGFAIYSKSADYSAPGY